MCTHYIFKEKGWEDCRNEHDILDLSKNEVNLISETTEKRERSHESMRRAKEKAFDIAMLNEFDWFITWTLNKEKLDREDPKEIIKKLSKFLNNMQQRKNLKYLIVPEYHLDEKGIHMHGLISGDLKLEKAINPHTKEFLTYIGKERETLIYNMLDWKYGWSTVIELDKNIARTSNYILKYITKQNAKIFGRYYLSSRNLKREVHTKLSNVSFADWELKEYSPSGTDFGFKYVIFSEDGEIIRKKK
jgi:hypothetical protein